MSLIYLDNAATSHPKPRTVYDVVNRCMRYSCGNPGRGSHPMALAAAQTIYECRSRLAEFFGAPSAGQVVFTLNATYAINLLIKGLLNKGDHILISDMEHNAAWRPVERCRQEGYINYSVFPSMLSTEEEYRCRTPTRICARIAARLKPETRAVLCIHQSNICSATMPLQEIGMFCRRHGLLFLVDASQSAGHLSIDMKKMCIDGLAAPAHKGLLGIQGCGFAIFEAGLVPDTLIEGGSGYASLSASMPDELPERAEAGTLPTPAIAGLAAGLSFLQSNDISALSAHDRTLFSALRDRLFSLKNYRIALPEFEGSTLMFYRDGIPSDKIGAYLSEHGICVRTGYHCAALAHKTLHSPDGGGVRVSFGPFNTLQDVEMLYDTLRHMEQGYEIK